MRCAVIFALILSTLGGCASQSISIRSVPSEDPAAENAAAVESAADPRVLVRSWKTARVHGACGNWVVNGALAFWN